MAVEDCEIVIPPRTQLPRPTQCPAEIGLILITYFAYYKRVVNLSKP